MLPLSLPITVAPVLDCADNYLTSVAVISKVNGIAISLAFVLTLQA